MARRTGLARLAICMALATTQAALADPAVERALPPVAELPAPRIAPVVPAQRPAAPALSPLPAPAQRDAAARYAAQTDALLEATPEPAPPRPRRRVPASCTSDGLHCIGPLTYLGDVCRVIGTTAREAGLDPHFFARLIWRESLFDAYAISPAGALGIAQFIPSTAAQRGLDDPFNPAEALRASAHYLSLLRDRFGNVGLAAGAYNGGEARMSRYLSEGGALPGETRAYVNWITGYRADRWRNDPPEALDLSLGDDKPFNAACVDWARARKAPTVAPDGPTLPWAMVYAAHADRDAAARRAEAMRTRFPALLGDTDGQLHRTRLPGSGRVLYTARLDAASRMTAARLCTRLRRAGGGCMVLRN